MMAFKTPVLLIAYRRPDTTKKVIDAIRVAAPERMFVACDDPNLKNPGEAEKVAATRALIEREIDWPCKIERRYSETNQGCKMGVSSAITWFFEQVEEGIIIEDDCVAHPDFFPYWRSFWSAFAMTAAYGISAAITFRMASGGVTEATTLATFRIPGAGPRGDDVGNIMT